MRKQTERCLPKGLLLVEAVLASVVMTTGLVLISRGLGGQLKALRRLEEQQATLAAANRQLAEWEALGMFSATMPTSAAVESIDVAGKTYRRIWSVGEPVLSDMAGIQQEIARWVTVTVGGVRLTTVWPTTWVPDEWPRQ